MAVVYTPTLRGRRLALELRRLRERAELTQTEAARRVGWTKSKLSRIEIPEVRAADDDVAALLQLYGMDHDRHDAILRLNRDAWKRGWWTHYDGVFTGNFVMLEEQAEELLVFENALVPGLLQTPDYARALISELIPAGVAEVDRIVAGRMQRKHVLDRTNPPRVHALIDEAVFHRPIGGPDVMRKQVASLWDAAVSRPHVTIQVVPFNAVVHAGLDGVFTLFGFPSEPGLEVAHSEDLLGERYAESTEAVTKIRLAFAHVAGAALPPEESVAYMESRARD